MTMRPNDQRPDYEKMRAIQEQAHSFSGPVGKQRHGCLTVWLVLMIFGSIGAILIWGRYDEQLSTVFPPILILAVSINSVVEIFFLIGTLYWKRWAVQGFILTVIVSFLLRILMGIVRDTSFLSIGFAFFMLLVFVRPNWHHYEGRELIGFEK